MRKLVYLTVCMVALSAHADLYWSSGTYVISNQLGVALAASKTVSSSGCFAQLIYCGSDGQIDDFSVSTTTGTTDNDVVVATMWCGQNAGVLLTQGRFYQQGSPAVVGTSGTGNGNYYTRVYNAPNQNFNLGTNAPIPSAATYYWQSDAHPYTHSSTSPDYWVFATGSGNQTTIPIPVPEPAMFGLGLVGLISLRLFARKRK